MQKPSSHLNAPGTDRNRGRRTSMPSCISSAGPGGLKWGFHLRNRACKGNQDKGATTVKGSNRATRNMRSRMNKPAVGCPAWGNRVVRTTTRGSSSAIGGIRLAGKPVVRLAIAPDARRPVALGFDEAARSRSQLRPAALVGQKLEDLGRQRVDIARAEQNAGFLVADQFAMAA